MKTYFFAILFLFSLKSWAHLYDVGYFLNNDNVIKKIFVTEGTYGAWYDIRNNHASRDYFVPTKTSTEWLAFKTNPPANVTVTQIYPLDCRAIWALRTSMYANPTNETYTIYPAGGTTTYNAYCDFTWNPGASGKIGWTRMNLSLSSALKVYSTTPANSLSITAIDQTDGSWAANDFINTINIWTDATGLSLSGSDKIVPSITVTSPFWTHNQVAIFLTRTTVTQCLDIKTTTTIPAFPTSPTYTNLTNWNNYHYDGGSWTSMGSHCTWSTPFATGTTNVVTLSGQDTLLRLVENHTGTTGYLNLVSTLSSVGDNGAISVQLYVY